MIERRIAHAMGRLTALSPEAVCILALCERHAHDDATLESILPFAGGMPDALIASAFCGPDPEFCIKYLRAQLYAGSYCTACACVVPVEGWEPPEVYLPQQILDLVQDLYENRTWIAVCGGKEKVVEGFLNPEKLGLLSDMLIDAGYDDGDVLEHLRSAGPHFLGCWGVEWIHVKAKASEQEADRHQDREDAGADVRAPAQALESGDPCRRSCLCPASGPASAA